MSAPARRDPVVLAAFAFAAASRAAFAYFLPAGEIATRRYLAPALEFARGRWLSPLSADQLPGAPLLFAPFAAVGGENFAALALVQHALGLAALALAVRLAARAGGPRAARWTAWLLALQLILPFQERLLFSEAAAYFFLAAALNAAFELRENPAARPRAWALGGAAAAACALTRGEFLVVGPLAAAALAWPRAGRRLLLAGVYAAGWALTLGAWMAHNRLSGCPGFNSLGSSLLLDEALPFVRWDLPTHDRAKNVLKEEISACGGARNCTPRLQAVERLSDPARGGDSQCAARREYGAVALEAVLSSPRAWAAVEFPKLLRGLRPIAWVDEGLLLLAGRPAPTPGRDAFWAFLRRGPQYAGWLPFALVLLLPFARPGAPWLARLCAGLAFALVVAAVPADMSARLQASWTIPLCLAGALSADGFADALRRRDKSGS